MLIASAGRLSSQPLWETEVGPTAPPAGRLKALRLPLGLGAAILRAALEFKSGGCHCRRHLVQNHLQASLIYFGPQSVWIVMPEAVA